MTIMVVVGFVVVVVFVGGVLVGGHNAARAEAARGTLATWAGRAVAWVRARLGGRQ